MPLFHSTLQDAINALNKGHMERAKKILATHHQAELRETDFIESSVYALKVYLQNYGAHMKRALDKLKNEKISETDMVELVKDINKCKQNIQAFEEGTKELLRRENSLA